MATECVIPNQPSVSVTKALLARPATFLLVPRHSARMIASRMVPVMIGHIFAAATHHMSLLTARRSAARLTALVMELAILWLACARVTSSSWLKLIARAKTIAPITVVAVTMANATRALACANANLAFVDLAVAKTFALLSPFPRSVAVDSMANAQWRVATVYPAMAARTAVRTFSFL